jgi:hypothetical protein
MIRKISNDNFYLEVSPPKPLNKLFGIIRQISTMDTDRISSLSQALNNRRSYAPGTASDQSSAMGHDLPSSR